MLARLLVLPLACLLLIGANGLQLRYALDPDASDVSAKVAFFGLASKTARFPKVSGQVRLAPDNPADIALDVTLDARALVAPDKVTQERLRGEKFFWVEKYPTVRFVGSDLQLTSDRKGKVTGQLTARGVTRPVTLAVIFDTPPAKAQPGEAIQLSGETTINRRDFGMKSYSLIVGKDVTIGLKARMVPR
ncbi:MAG: YceI family protein [Sphingomonadaceae bacterium]|nr:YceI family protein [Sphingomonadaceae bacterium]